MFQGSFRADMAKLLIGGRNVQQNSLCAGWISKQRLASESSLGFNFQRINLSTNRCQIGPTLSKGCAISTRSTLIIKLPLKFQSFSFVK